MEEKRVQLGIDVGELSNQLVQINNLIEQNYQKSIQGQEEYNRLLETSIDSLKKQVDLVNKLGPANQFVVGSTFIGSSGIGSTSQPQGGSLEDIAENIESIWEWLSELGTPIPVNIMNTPLKVVIDNREGGEASNTTVNGGVVAGGRSANGDGGGRSASQYANMAASLFQKDPNFILPAAALAVPWVGSAVSSVLSKLLQEAENRERARARLIGTTGLSGYNLGSFVDIGLSQAEAMQKEAAYYRQNVNLDRSDLYFERGWNLSSGTMSSLLQSMRKDLISTLYPEDREYDSSSVSAYRYLRGLSDKGGILEEEVRGYSEEYLKILVDLNQKQLDTTGKTYSLLNSDFIQSISQLSSNFDDPVRLSRVINSLYGGLQQANTPQMEAMQYYTLSRVNPNASLWEMQLMREDPFGRGRGYFGNLMNLLLQTGNEQDVKFNIMNAFGLKATDVEDMMEGLKEEMKKPGFDIVQYLENSNFKFSSIGGRASEEGVIISEGRKATATAEVGIAKMTDIMADLGTPLLNTQTKILGKIDELLGKLDKWIGDSVDNSINSIIHNETDPHYHNSLEYMYQGMGVK